MTAFSGFPKETLRFLKELQQHNNREWFAENKSRYEEFFIGPSLALIDSLKKPLDKIAPLLRVESKRQGGSLMRIYKDTRFSKDKTPYKTNIGIQFQHQSGKDVHSPGIYFHVAPDECFVGAGIWKPESSVLRKIRTYIDENPIAWRRARQHKSFAALYELFDDRLKSVPRGFAKDHPLIDDLRLRSFIGSAPLSSKQVESPELVALIIERIKAARPLMTALCDALEVPY